MVNIDSTTDTIITVNSLPSILIGGPPNAGKSVLTYNLTRELRRLEIPHYVFRASADIEGDWFLKGSYETVFEIQQQVKDYRRWTDEFRDLVCRTLARRYFPLIVDLGGRPKEADTCIFLSCTHSILLLKDEEKQDTETWRHFTTINNLEPLAELRSQLEGKSILTVEEPTLTGTITGLQREKRIHNNLMFDAVLERVSQLFRKYPLDKLEKFHLANAPVQPPVNLLDRLHAWAPDTDEWAADMLRLLLAELPAKTAIAVYGRAPNWVYGALALHAGTQPFHQFDALLGWTTPPTLQASASGQSSESLIYVHTDNYDDAYVIRIHPIHNYLDRETEADQLVFPEPPLNRGVIVTGKLPLWLFTALARFYAQRNVPWIALNDASDNRPVVIYSQVHSHPIGKILPKLV